mmetsp:Transcript_27478/g.62235  ORF Transcript_27478/g.62235 Transcript_27478/m.62235 type:complete len:372 (+) Transcript_27478:175-1290(+)
MGRMAAAAEHPRLRARGLPPLHSPPLPALSGGYLPPRGLSSPGLPADSTDQLAKVVAAVRRVGGKASLSLVGGLCWSKADRAGSGRFSMFVASHPEIFDCTGETIVLLPAADALFADTDPAPASATPAAPYTDGKAPTPPALHLAPDSRPGARQSGCSSTPGGTWVDDPQHREAHPRPWGCPSDPLFPWWAPPGLSPRMEGAESPAPPATRAAEQGPGRGAAAGLCDDWAAAVAAWHPPAPVGARGWALAAGDGAGAGWPEHDWPRDAAPQPVPAGWEGWWGAPPPISAAQLAERRLAQYCGDYGEATSDAGTSSTWGGAFRGGRSPRSEGTSSDTGSSSSLWRGTSMQPWAAVPAAGPVGYPLYRCGRHC